MTDQVPQTAQLMGHIAAGESKVFNDHQATAVDELQHAPQDCVFIPGPGCVTADRHRPARPRQQTGETSGFGGLRDAAAETMNGDANA